MKLIVLCTFVLTISDGNSNNFEISDLPQEKLLDAICQSFCKQNDSSLCYHNECDCGKTNFKLTDYEGMLNVSSLRLPELNCKEENILHFIWKAQDDFAYFFEVTNQKSNMFSETTTCNSLILTNLTEASTYQIRFWSASFSNKEIHHSELFEITTSNKETAPAPVLSIFIENMTLDDDKYEAVLKWTPNDDRSCIYDIVILSRDSIDEREVNVISDSYNVILYDLPFETNYTGHIIARSSNEMLESTKKEFSFATPSCLVSYASLKVCRPEAPKNLVVNESLVEANSPGGNFICDIHMRWSEPNLTPDYYEAHFLNIPDDGQNSTEKFVIISGNETSAVLKNVDPGMQYQISLMACSAAGCSAKVAENRHRFDIPSISKFPSSSSSVGLILTLTAILILVPSVIIVMVCINRYRAKQQRKEERYKYFMELEDKPPEPEEAIKIDATTHVLSDQWELDPSKLFFGNILGEGAFGVVRRGRLKIKDDEDVDVAIKMLKESPTSEEVRHFSHEIEIMKSVKHHPYIVSLIGCITINRPDGPLLVVEYCARGDLQTYLRSAWEKYNNMQHEINYANSSPNYFANIAYDFHNANPEDEFIIQPKHLLSIARQVALGMDHLAKTRVVHRDLAARNVLVCQDHTVKVSDFGLSRDVYQDNVYCKSGGGKLPIRWMALESLTHQRYTTQSDVWSFGILLWEIVTLGGTPYVGIHTGELLDLLKSGYRLKCPSTCSSDLYAIMQSCWKEVPNERPTFSNLCYSLDGLLEDVSHYIHLENVETAVVPEEINLDTNSSDQRSDDV